MKMDKKEEDLELSGIDVLEVLSRLNTSSAGLTDEQAKKRIEEHGPNLISTKKEINLFLEFMSHFTSPLIIILIAAAIISAYFGQSVDAIIIIILVFFSVILDFYQEHKAEKSVEKLIEQVKTTSTVIRNGEKKEIRTRDVCIGDIIFLSSGDLIPADARVISAKDFFVNQSSLTGESFPCEKHEAKLDKKNQSLSELSNIVFSGTSVISGSATAVVIRIGKNTEFGKIAEKLSRKEEKSEFEKGITDFGYLIMKIMIFLVMFIFLFNSLIHNNMLEAFMFSIAIAVGITPELLPMIMSVTMAKGSSNMAKKGVIVKKLSAIPNLGSMDVLCTDKTGTLTEDKISLVKYVDLNGKESEKVLLYAYLNSVHQTGIKNPLDEAVISFRQIDVSRFRKIDEIPFDFQRKRMSIIIKDKKSLFLVTKGAPEEIFKVCKYYHKNGKKNIFNNKVKSEFISYYHSLSSEGYRVLGLAIKDVKNNNTTYSKNDECDLELLGFIAFLDPAKKDVKETLEQLEGIGVDIKIITGDNEFVTRKICDDIGISIKGMLLGSEVDLLSDDALKHVVEKTTIFARFSPEQKNRIIHTLKSNGHVVGYMGDGINDAPSLKNADIGISVNNGVDVAKEAADIVLTQKSLSALKEGIIDGRKAFGNTMKYVMMSLSSNFGNMFSAAGAILFLPFLPMLPIQILLINFIYDFSQITIPDDNVDDEWLRKPKRWNLAFIEKFMYVFGPLSSLFDYITFIVLFYVMGANALVFHTGWFLESLATQTLVIHIIRTKKTPLLESRPSRYLVISTIACVALGWILPYTSIGRLFGFEPLTLTALFAIIGIVIAYLITIEIAKKIFYHYFDF